MRKCKEYALYKGEELLAIGTKKKLADKFKVKVETISFYTTPTKLKRNKSNNCRVVVALD